MTKDIKLRLKDVSSSNPGNLEAVFSLGNGHFGVRATNPIESSAVEGTLVNGFFEYSPINYGEAAAYYPKRNETIVSLPNLRKIRVFDDGHGEFTHSKLVDMQLDLSNGKLVEEYELSNDKKQTIKMNVTSAIDQREVHFYGIEYAFEAETYKGDIYIDKNFVLEEAKGEAGDDIDDPRKTRELKSIKREVVATDDLSQTIAISTAESKQRIEITAYGFNDESHLSTKLSLADEPKVSYGFIVGEKNEKGDFAKEDFATIKENSASFWHDTWQNGEVSIAGNDELNLALHYNIFQLNQATGRDGKTNIAAKGLTGPGYEGHTFWDTEMYMIPYFIYTKPEIAKKLLVYRYNTLDFARTRARELGVNQGALFAWRSINGEETSAYYPASTAAYHLDGDIAYAIGNYYQATHDMEFLKDYGFEMLLETARFFREFGTWAKKDGKTVFEFHTVTGPDEYTAMVDNNYFTNRMAQNNFNLAYKLGLVLMEKDPEAFGKLGVSIEELEAFKDIAEKIYFPFNDEYQINAQDDTFFSKAIWPFDETPKDKYPLLLHYHPLNIYRYQVNKQADTVLADLLFPETIDDDQLSREFDYYEKITTHDSSLSRSIFSALAARMGDMKKAYSYFSDTVRMDLTDLQGNTEDGLHLANLGGSWLSVVQGFAGMQVTSAGELKIIPHLPIEWDGFEFRIVFNGRLLNINIVDGKTTIKLVDGQPMNIIVDNKSYKLEKATLEILSKGE
ncbi:Alpha,alpha-trehalose phosphorylase [Apilactobacillus kunkeei]|uniref:glycoside hydrolase family 65 protein n=1 Tax=Apilactobacillus kunkeei TaxID=148814 RepID=UPI0021FA3FC3|nr:glycosyl hydrolase family 65 protein [Apilactobacillus kunkeei]UZX33288.1 glycoside hydrolase family 65 protein [Apilactobacillus kunkeei]CAI2551681.1 Alpha,alpha-trehalose phosphorylase [Apilactobacillus kunkeei]CAI2551991.1 Alpha,alpha-trehalose phosphorylase [Apilactobacillus kunkeei]CAI2552117.1 Alpha,alpha-trehalose phosphorylase [Apilactobacillus kunkeei]CAI2552165.1 Alpha,alpha-trehalose phosphorylase [Apilactobacillus kunkeei]